MVEMKGVDAPRRDARSDSSAFAFDDRTADHRPNSDEGLGTLLRQLADQGTHLADKQVELVKAEIRSSITQAEEAAGAMAGAAVLGIAGLGVTLMAIAYLLGTFMSMWLGTLIVGVGTLAIAYAMFAAGRSKLSARSLNLDRTEHTLGRTPSAITGKTKEDRHNG